MDKQKQKPEEIKKGLSAGTPIPDNPGSIKPDQEPKEEKENGNK